MQTDTLGAACLGKLPTHGDFVSHRASTPTMRALDEWVRKGLYQARQRSAGPWDEAYDQAPTTHFFFGGGPKAPNALMGVWHPSRDRSGRAYPFMVTCEVPTSQLHAPDLARLPLHAERFYTAADRIVREATAGEIPYRDVADRVAQIATDVDLRAPAPRTYAQYLQQPLEVFLRDLLGHFQDSGKYRLFGNLLQILLPLQDRPSLQLNYGLQFPLRPHDEALTRDACFWLDTTLRLLGTPSAAEPTFFWTAHRPSHAAPFLLLFLGLPRPDAFVHLLAPDAKHERAYPLLHAGAHNTADAALNIPERYGTLLEDRDLRLADFLHRL